MDIQSFTAQDERDMVATYQAGTSVAQIARKYDCPWARVAKVLRRHGVYEGVHRSASTKRTETMGERYVAGASLAQIGQEFGVSPVRVLQLLRKLGHVEMRPAGGTAPRHVDEIQELRESGLSAQKIAAELGISISTVRKWLRRMGMASQQGSVGPGAEHQTWKGGTRVMGGYRTVWLPKTDPFYAEMAWSNNYVFEHRLVAARKIGRPLARHETVHHINGDILDNRPENLQLRQGRHGKGVRYTCQDCGSHNVTTTTL